MNNNEPCLIAHCPECHSLHKVGCCSAILSRVIETKLNLFPEVKWGRWTGDLSDEMGIAVFGWIAREDGKSDFLFLRIDKDGIWMITTSSAKHSDDFVRRAGFEGGHEPCKRVEASFRNVPNVTQL